MFEAFAKSYKAEVKANLELMEKYKQKVFSPEELEKSKKDKISKLLRSFYIANLGFDPEEEKSTSEALIKIEYKTPKFKADDLRTLWYHAVDAKQWDSKGVSGRNKSKFTLYNPKGKPFRVKARIGAYVKATPVGIFVLAYDVIINNRVYLRECFINIKHVRWLVHPFTALNKMKPGDCKLIEDVIGLSGEKAVPSIRCQKAMQ
jgi:hypothetical protein